MRTSLGSLSVEGRIGLGSQETYDFLAQEAGPAFLNLGFFDLGKGVLPDERAPPGKYP